MARGAAITLILALLLLAGMQASAYESRKIISSELVESQYSFFGYPLPFGDRLYLVTYEGGQQQYIVTIGSGLGKATIVESTSTVWCTAGRTCDINFRAKAPNLPRFALNGYATHKFELYDDSGSYPVPIDIKTDTQVPTTYGKLETITLPNTYSAGKKYMFIKEYVKDLTSGQWIAGYDSGSSELRLDVIFTEQVQATPIPPPTATPSSASLRIESSPSGATVKYSGAYLGTTPFTMTLLAGESKILEFTLSGYVTQYKGVSSSSSNPFLAVMSPVSAPPTTEYQCSNGLWASDLSACPTPTTIPTVTATVAATATSTPTAPTATATSTIQQEQGSGGITYRGVDITYSDGYYYVGDIKHSTLAEAKATIDELMAAKEEKKTPGFEAVFAIAGLFAVAYLVLRQKPKKEKEEK